MIVAAELHNGTTKKASPRLRAQVEAVLGAIDTLPFDGLGHLERQVIESRYSLKRFLTAD